MIVSKSYYLACLIITDTHQHNLHTGREQALCFIRNFYWILSCLGLIRTVSRECLYCKRYTVKGKTTYMADLPKHRMLAGQKPFTSTGIDLFGPTFVKRTKQLPIFYGITAERNISRHQLNGKRGYLKKVTLRREI